VVVNLKKLIDIDNNLLPMRQARQDHDIDSFREPGVLAARQIDD
jgi:hypothetical protein